jgi:hypothetical protein
MGQCPTAISETNFFYFAVTSPNVEKIASESATKDTIAANGHARFVNS